MHDNELAIDEALVAALIADQFPQWSDLPLERLESHGTVNAIYRLGRNMAARLPVLVEYSADILKERHWGSHVAPHLPLATPVQVGMGSPGNGYPSNWSVVKWIDGENATPDNLLDLSEAGGRLGEFVSSLRGIRVPDAPIGSNRGGHLSVQDVETRRAIKAVGAEFEPAELAAVWESALKTPYWVGTPVWFHGDLHAGNLLASGGRLSAVIDLGECGVGDPAVDTMAAWWLFEGESRDAFRRALGVDDNTWNRGRGWALSIALIALPYYIDRNPVLAEMSRTAINQVLGDYFASRGSALSVR